MATWQAKKVPELRAELKRRDLPFKGRKETLVARLEHTDGLPIDRVGRESYYKEEAKRYREAALANVVTFPYFTRLPLEIQRYIWKFSLPGPRVLRYQNDRMHAPICEHRLFFRKDWQPLNPAALSTCRESRSIALKRYKLCFGTTNVYADLPGGDILYLCDPGLTWEWNLSVTSTRNGRRHKTVPVHKMLCDDVIKDLEAVTHVILPGQVWCRSSVLPFVSVSDGGYTRRMLRRFKSLAQVSLASVRSSDPYRAFVGYSTLSNHVSQQAPMTLDSINRHIFEDRSFLSQQPYWPDVETINAWIVRRQEIFCDSVSISFISGFDLWNLQEDEFKNGIPETRVVELEHIACMPQTVEENYRGYPVPWCCERDMSAEPEERPRSNARYNLRRA